MSAPYRKPIRRVPTLYDVPGEQRGPAFEPQLHYWPQALERRLETIKTRLERLQERKEKMTRVAINEARERIWQGVLQFRDDTEAVATAHEEWEELDKSIRMSLAETKSFTGRVRVVLKYCQVWLIKNKYLLGTTDLGENYAAGLVAEVRDEMTDRAERKAAQEAPPRPVPREVITGLDEFIREGDHGDPKPR